MSNDWRLFRDTEFRGKQLGLLGGDEADEKEFKTWYRQFCKRMQEIGAQAQQLSALQLATTDELWTELSKRFDSVGLAGVVDKTPKLESYLIQWKGSAPGVIGMIDILRGDIKRHVREMRGV